MRLTKGKIESVKKQIKRNVPYEKYFLEIEKDKHEKKKKKKSRTDRDSFEAESGKNSWSAKRKDKQNWWTGKLSYRQSIQRIQFSAEHVLSELKVHIMGQLREEKWNKNNRWEKNSEKRRANHNSIWDWKNRI